MNEEQTNHDSDMEFTPAFFLFNDDYSNVTLNTPSSITLPCSLTVSDISTAQVSPNAINQVASALHSTTVSSTLVAYSSSEEEDAQSRQVLSTISLTSVFGNRSTLNQSLNQNIALQSSNSTTSTLLLSPPSPASSIVSRHHMSRSSSFSSASSKPRSPSIKSRTKEESSDDDITIIESDESDQEEYSNRRKRSSKKAKYTPKKKSSFGGPSRTAIWFRYVR